MHARASAKSEHASGQAAPHWMTLLGASEKGGRDCAPRVEGALPAALQGSLYRNGPGLFERGGARKAHLLDGDGLIQRLSIADGRVRYQNAFVHTPKFDREEKAGRPLYATWTTRRPGGFMSNLGGPVAESQAGVTIYPVHGKLLARDESGPSYMIDPDTLATVGAVDAGAPVRHTSFKAHSKLDPQTGEWLTIGTGFGRTMSLHEAVYAPELQLRSHLTLPSPRQVYIHDFFATRGFFVHVLHPCYFRPFPFLLGRKSFTESLDWRGEDGNLVVVHPRGGGDPILFDAPGAFMWHALNAYEAGDEIVADFVAYDAPDHFLGDGALLRTIMDGRMGLAQQPGKIRRYAINLRTRTLSEEIIDAGNHEFPMIDERTATQRHTIGYSAFGGPGLVNSGVKRLDYRTGAAQQFDFGAETHVGEPVFAPRPGAGLDEGWILAECLDGRTETTFFALFDAQTIGAGPVAKIWLDHHVPMSFHGAWKAA